MGFFGNLLDRQQNGKRPSKTMTTTRSFKHPLPPLFLQPVALAEIRRISVFVLRHFPNVAKV
ncbi:hypothetical protein CAI21_11945 [Alkalilimnicola ehrlichii]|uniref:Uncharacterized protein n=1 Tax=Alkalilimnicola ehrlichii TaxID=351052 RepID=A0A3E0WUT0_9GAMM|nr:hypothetical protein CAI21_11945 [Alkalilimnicola ehrlichii]RFA35735.1 hypothetical protein CAL65_12465 [Alkalilimnicola ehrlichii]